jgi:hypothetical protein
VIIIFIFLRTEIYSNRSSSSQVWCVCMIRLIGSQLMGPWSV